MSRLFRLYWLREDGCDSGASLRAEQLEPEIQLSVLALAGDESGELFLRLPYIDRREWRKRAEILAELSFERQGNVISAVLGPEAALRNAAANLALADPAWLGAPGLANPCYFQIWRSVSIALQSCLREWVAQQYFSDPSRYEERDAAYTMICYKAARVFRGGSRGDFTYDLRDYPECRLTLALALKMTGQNIRVTLGEIEQKLQAAGMVELARRYMPLWQQDVVRAVQKRPKALIELLAAESAFINALVELGLDRTPSGVHTFAKLANQSLRKVYGMDARHLGVRALDETTRILAAKAVTDDALCA